MSEIEKLYENAGIDYEERYNNCTLNKEGECNLECSCDICEYSEEKYIYPPFTAEKRSKIMEVIIEKGIIKGYEGKGGSVEEAFAGLINNLWQDLTDVEKAQIKEILE